MEITNEVLHGIHGRMVRARMFAEALISLGGSGRLPAPVVTSVGAEAVTGGLCAALGADDQLSSRIVDPGLLVAAGAVMVDVLAELVGHEAGCNRGRAGPTEVQDPAAGVLAGGAAVGVGAAFANKYRDHHAVSVVLFDDTEANIGGFHEAINMAATLELPAVFVCERNDHDSSRSPQRTMAIDDVVDRASGYGMAGVIVDGMDPVAVFEATTHAVGRARAGRGPSFVEAKTNRPRSTAERQADDNWPVADPVAAFERMVIAYGLLTQGDVDDTQRTAFDEVRRAIESVNLASSEAAEAAEASTAAEDDR